MRRDNQQGAAFVELLISMLVLLPILVFISYFVLSSIRYWQATYSVVQALRQARVNLLVGANGETPQEIILTSVQTGLQSSGYAISPAQLTICSPPYSTACGCSLEQLEVLRLNENLPDPNNCRGLWFDRMLMIRVHEDLLGNAMYHLFYAEN